MNLKIKTMKKTEIDILKKKVLGEIKRDTNGAVVGAMSDYNNGEVFFSFGVSVPKIKAVAKEYYPNHELAMELFNTSIRELKIVAVYIDDEKKITEAQMEKWQESFNSLEIAEHCASMLFYKSTLALNMAEIWIGKKDKFTQKAGYLIAAKRAKFMYDSSEGTEYLNLFDKAIRDLIDRENPHTAQAAEQFLVAIANKNNEAKENLVKHIKSGDLGESATELEWQIDFNN